MNQSTNLYKALDIFIKEIRRGKFFYQKISKAYFFTINYDLLKNNIDFVMEALKINVECQKYFDEKTKANSQVRVYIKLLISNFCHH